MRHRVARGRARRWAACARPPLRPSSQPPTISGPKACRSGQEEGRGRVGGRKRGLSTGRPPPRGPRKQTTALRGAARARCSSRLDVSSLSSPASKPRAKRYQAVRSPSASARPSTDARATAPGSASGQDPCLPAEQVAGPRTLVAMVLAGGGRRRRLPSTSSSSRRRPPPDPPSCRPAQQPPSPSPLRPIPRLPRGRRSHASQPPSPSRPRGPLPSPGRPAPAAASPPSCPWSPPAS